jgi:hypothetical protein
LLALAGKPPLGGTKSLRKNRPAREFFKFAIDLLTSDDWQAIARPAPEKREQKLDRAKAAYGISVQFEGKNEK